MKRPAPLTSSNFAGAGASPFPFFIKPQKFFDMPHTQRPRHYIEFLELTAPPNAP